METAQATSTANSSEMFTDRDLEIGYDEETSAQITLSGDSASSDSDAVQISGNTVPMTDEGTYILSGTLSNGMIVVSAEDGDKVQLVLNGVEITNDTSAAIYILEADKVFITTVSGTENLLVNGGQYVAIDDNNIDAVIFSKADLTLNGTGTLTIHAAAGHGVVSKDDLITITSGKDGIHAENTDNTSLGFLYIQAELYHYSRRTRHEHQRLSADRGRYLYCYHRRGQRQCHDDHGHHGFWTAGRFPE